MISDVQHYGHDTQLYTRWFTDASVAFAEAKFLARQAAEQLLSFQMQQSEAELNQSDVRYLCSVAAKTLVCKLPEVICFASAWSCHAAAVTLMCMLCLFMTSPVLLSRTWSEH